MEKKLTLTLFSKVLKILLTSNGWHKTSERMTYDLPYIFVHGSDTKEKSLEWVSIDTTSLKRRKTITELDSHIMVTLIFSNFEQPKFVRPLPYIDQLKLKE